MKLKTLCLVAVFLLFISCGNSGKTNEESIEEANEILYEAIGGLLQDHKHD